MTLEDYAELHPVDRTFLEAGHRENLRRQNEEK